MRKQNWDVIACAKSIYCARKFKCRTKNHRIVSVEKGL